MRLEHIGPLGFLNWFRDDWLVTRLAMRLFLLATMLVLALTPIEYGWVKPTHFSFWANLGWLILVVAGLIALVFLMFGMWRYWLRVDDSGRWVKRFWFLALLVGIWWWYGLCLYCWIVYVPKVIRGIRAGIVATSVSHDSLPEEKNIAFTLGTFGRILISCWAIFFGGMFLTVLVLKPGKVPVWFPAPWVLRGIMLVLIFTSCAYGLRWLYRLGMGH